jgi:hypothetical protein
MPSKGFSALLDRYYENDEERIKIKKERDNIQQKIRFYRRSWNYNVRKSDYAEFSKYSKEISKIKNIHDFFINLDKSNIKTEQDLFLYGKFYNQIEYVYKNPAAVAYIKTLKKIDNDNLKALDTDEETSSLESSLESE